MTNDDRQLDSDILVFHLDEEIAKVAAASRREAGPTARTLVKNDRMSVTLVSLAAGGSIKEHHAAGPITLHVLTGRLEFVEPNGVHELAAGDLLSLGAGIRHSVTSGSGASFIITIVL